MSEPPPTSLDEGTSLALTSAGDVETLVRAHGTSFFVTNRSGDVAPAAARELGLFDDDTRHLSHWELGVVGHALVYLSSDAFDPAENRIDLMVAGVEGQEFLDDPQNFLHVHRRQLVDDGMREQIDIVNYLQHMIDVEIVIAFAADFADVFEIRGARRSRRGTLQAPVVDADSVTLSYLGLDRERYVTRIAFAPAPAVLDGHRAVFRFSIPAGDKVTIDARATPVDRGGVTERTFDVCAAAERGQAEAFFEDSARIRCDDAILERVFRQGSADLRALSIDVGDHRVLAAGIPWFSCPFGRDTLIAAYEALLLNPSLAASSLRALAAFQGKTFDRYTEEEPGKIFHELRFGEMARCRETPHQPYYGSVDATPLFVVVLHATYEITADLALVTELADALRAALGWIDRRSEDGTKLVTYERVSSRGLDNQGWKDSRAGVSFPDGKRAEPPIALAEVQGYCVDAYRRGAELLAVLGDADASKRYAERATCFGEVVDRVLWLENEGRYAFAVDGRGRALPTVVSNTGHLLWSRVPSPERARLTAELLVQPTSLSPFGLRTLAAGQPVYNPLSYHNGTVWPHDNALVAQGLASFGMTGHARRIFETIIAAMDHFKDRRLPELYCGTSRDGALVRYPVACSPQAWAAAAPFLLLRAVLGIELDGAAQRVVIRNPRLPRSVRRIEIERVRVGRSRVSIGFRRDGDRCHVDRLDVEGAPLRTLVELD